MVWPTVQVGPFSMGSKGYDEGKIHFDAHLVEKFGVICHFESAY